MARSQQRLLSQLATSDNELASGLGQCLEALRLISALPRASPVFVKYASTTKAFGREHLSRVPLRTVITLIKTSLGLPDPVRVTTALFYREDGSIDPTPVLVDEDSWRELAPYVHTLHVEDDVGAVPVLSLSSLAGTVAPSNGTSPSSGGVGKATGLNSNASAFVPSAIKTGGEGAGKVNLQSLRQSSFSPSSSQPTSPFAILDNTGTCV